VSAAHSLARPKNNSVSLGLNVVRTWAFCDGDRPGALQPNAGVYSEQTFAALDSVVAQAGAAGVRLVLTLTNYWSDFGGVQQYASWVGIPQQGTLPRERTSVALNLSPPDQTFSCLPMLCAST